MSGDFNQAFDPPVNLQMTNLPFQSPPAAELPPPELPVQQKCNAADVNVNVNVNIGVNNSVNSQKLIRARQSFSLKEKLAFVMEYQKACLDDSDDPSASGGVKFNINGNKKRARSTSTSMDDNKKKCKLKSWLKEKNERDGTSIAYGTIYKWFKRYGKMEHDDAQLSSMGNLKKVRKRPYEELESILVQYLRVRNETLRSQGLPASNASFIKEKAVMFHKDMYGDGMVDGAPSEFKCSTGWVHRFRSRYMYILDPIAARKQELGIRLSEVENNIQNGGAYDLDGSVNYVGQNNIITMQTLNDSILQNGHQLQLRVPVPGDEGAII